jgi:hypothetical protein
LQPLNPVFRSANLIIAPLTLLLTITPRSEPQHNNSLDASGTSGLCYDNLTVAWLTAAASTQSLGGFASSKHHCLKTMMLSVDNFLGLLDRLIRLGNYRVEGRRRQFKEIVEPLFNEIQPLVDDYFVLFRDSHSLVRKSSVSELHLAVENIVASRARLLQARTQAVVFAKVIESEVKDQRLISFAQTVVDFFYVTQHDEGKRRMSRTCEMVELFDLVLERKLKKGELLEHIKKTLDSLEISWMKLVQAYGVLKLRALK